MRSFLATIGAVFLISAAGFGQLPPATQKAYDAGIASAKAGDFTAAIKSLDDARKAAPDAPAIYYNLGLAESKIPGREVRAICALEAYLALSPNAENTPAVRKAIDGLEAGARANVDKMVEILKVGFAALNAPPRYGRQPEQSLPVLYLKLGQPEAAEATIRSIQAADRVNQYESSPDGARIALVDALIALDRLDDAAKQVDLIKDTNRQPWWTLAKAYINKGRFRDAKACLAKRNNIDTNLLLDLAVAESKAGMSDDAEARFQDAKLISETDAKRSGESWWLIRDMAGLAEARWKMGQKDVAEAMLKDMLSKTDAYSGGKSPNAARVHCLLSYSTVMENIGRHADAVKIMDKAEKYWQAQMRNAEEGLGIYNESTSIYNQYRWLLEWDRMQKFVTKNLDINKTFTNGAEGMAKFFKSYQARRIETERIKTATEAINKTVSNTATSPSQRAATWMQYADGFLTAPIFTTDFNVMLKNLVDYTPPADDYDKPRTIFAHVEEPAEAIVDALNNIEAIRERKPIVTNWGDSN